MKREGQEMKGRETVRGGREEKEGEEEVVMNRGQMHVVSGKGKGK